jgi:hypothetical protein
MEISIYKVSFCSPLIYITHAAMILFLASFKGKMGITEQSHLAKRCSQIANAIQDNTEIKMVASIGPLTQAKWEPPSCKG